jgi:hypothetical protein
MAIGPAGGHAIEIMLFALMLISYRWDFIMAFLLQIYDHLFDQASMYNNPGSADELAGRDGAAVLGNGLVNLDQAYLPHPEEEEEEEGEEGGGEPPLPQIWISKSASMELDLI